ncbi:MAG: hypothetical protein V9E96_16490 [Chitinophagaceae bacterium]
MYHQAKDAANGKQVIITETGWPSLGESLKGAVPSHNSSRDYFINTQMWSKASRYSYFLFLIISMNLGKLEQKELLVLIGVFGIKMKN